MCVCFMTVVHMLADEMRGKERKGREGKGREKRYLPNKLRSSMMGTYVHNDFLRTRGTNEQNRGTSDKTAGAGFVGRSIQVICVVWLH